MADGWHSEVSGSGAAVSFDASVEAGEFAFSGFQADLKALDFAEPAVHPCFGDALVQVADDLGKAGPLVPTPRTLGVCGVLGCVDPDALFLSWSLFP